MCIIAAKPAGVAMPKYEYISNMFQNNKDGAGLMYAANGKVHIEKGFMDEFSFASRLAELAKEHDIEKLPIAMHFRITTHGGTKPENCHPFPITDSMGMLKKLRCRTNIGVAHNGIIDVSPRSKDISDTMEYIAGRLAPLKRAMPNFYKNKDILQMIYHGITSKMVIMDRNGDMSFIGDFREEDGVKYSNTSYMYNYSSYRCFPYEMEGYDEYESYSYKELMWLDEDKGEYVKSKKGDFLQDDFAIDKNGNVYYFDSEMGMFVRLYGATAYNSNGGFLKFNPDSEFTCHEVVML